jgi:hypothetical protein
VAGEGDQVDVQLLQVEVAADLLFNGGLADHQRALGVDLDHGRLAMDDGVGVVDLDGLDDRAGVFVGLQGNEYGGHGGLSEDDAGFLDARLEGGELLADGFVGVGAKGQLDDGHHGRRSAGTPAAGPFGEHVPVGVGFGGGHLEHGVHPFAGLVEPVAHELGEHGHRRGTLHRQVLVHDALIDQRVEQAVEGHVLGHEEFEGVAAHQAVLHVAAQGLPGGRIEPGGLAGVEGFGVTQQQAQARQVLGDAQVVHGVVHARLGEGGAEAVAADKGVVLVCAPGGMAQGNQHLEGDVAQFVGEHVAQAAALDEAEVGLGGLLLAGAGQGVGAVVELARVFQGIPVGHHDAAQARVVEQVVRVPGGLVVQVLGGLDVVAALLVARSGLVAKTAHQVVKGLAPGCDGDRAEVDLHGGCLLLFGLSEAGVGGIGEAPVPVTQGGIGVARRQQFHPVGKAERGEGLAGEDHLDEDLRLADGKLEFDEAIGTLARGAHETAGGVHAGLSSRP